MVSYGGHNTGCQGYDRLSLFCYPQTGEKYDTSDAVAYPISSLRAVAQNHEDNTAACVGAGTILFESLRFK